MKVKKARLYTLCGCYKKEEEERKKNNAGIKEDRIRTRAEINEIFYK